MHLAEEWEYPYLTLLSGSCFLLSYLKIDNRSLQMLALASGLIPFALDFPDLANHGNLMLMIGSGLLLLMFNGEKPTDELCAYYLRPVLPFIYAFAGFHKLNADFFKTEVSCANDFMLRFSAAENADLIRQHWLAIVLPFAAAGWELSGLILLHIRKAQIWFLSGSALLHGFLALHHFADFGSLMLALFYLWIPAGLTSSMTGRKTKPAFTICFVIACFLPLDQLRFLSADRTFFLVGIFMLAGFVIYYRSTIDFKNIDALSSGAPIWNSPKQLLLPIILGAFSVSPYLGLRTSGNLTMFSNLKTEGPTSNHLLLTSNPFKIFALQEDLIKFVQIDPEHGTERRVWLKDYALPATELFKKAKLWREKKIKVPAVYWYNGELLETSDLAKDERWQQDPNLRFNAQWLDFRVVQPIGPNKCRW